MFKKKPNIKPQAPLRSSDRRKIAQQIIQDLSVAPLPIEPSADPAPDASTQAPNPDTALRNQLLPEGTAAAKFNTTQGPDLAPVNGTLYFSEDRVLWVRTDHHAPELFPTVYTLWRNPGLLPILLTHAPVLERLVGGADLMVPGLVGPFPAGAMTGRLVGIADVERPSVPIVVGVCEIDVARLARTVGEKGRAVRVLHWVGDEVYKHGSGGGGEVPQAIGAAEDVEVEKVTEKVQKLEVSEKDGSSGEEEVRPLETKEIDDAFYAAALYGFHDHAKSSKSVAIEFPLSSSAFISSLVHPYLPPASYFPPHNYLQNHGPHPSLQLKKSSWKNTAKFLKHLQGKKLVITKIRNGGETVITDIDWQHAEVLGFKPYKLPEAEKAPAAAASEPSSGKPSGMVKVEALFRPHGRNLKFFEAVSAGAKDYYTPTALKTLLNTYLDANNLAQPNNKRLVQLDPLLSNTLFLTTPADTAELAKAKGVYKRDQLGERLVSSCAPYYRITTPSGEEQKPKSGSAPKVQVVMEKRQGRKTVTRVFGLEPFGVDPKGLAEELQKICAGSATVGQAVALKPGLLEVMVQGSQAKEVEKALEKRGIPGRFVGVLDKTVGKK